MVVVFKRMGGNTERHQAHSEQESDAKRKGNVLFESHHRKNISVIFLKVTILKNKSYENFSYSVKLLSFGGRSEKYEVSRK